MKASDFDFELHGVIKGGHQQPAAGHGDDLEGPLFRAVKTHSKRGHLSHGGIYQCVTVTSLPIPHPLPLPLSP